MYADSARVGFVPHDRIPQYLSMADVFVSYPEYEGLGMVFIEAMACGVPVIGSNVGGIPDIIEDGKNGVLVPPQNVEKLAQAIEKLLRDENLRNRYAEEGLRTVNKKFLWESVLRRICGVHADLHKRA